MSPSAIPALLERLPAGPDRLSGNDCASWAVGGGPPAGVLFPRSTEEASVVMSAAHDSGVKVGFAGAGGHLASSLRSSPVDLLIGTRDLAGISQYEAADLTLTAGAGTTLGALRDAARANGQFLALDPPGARAATLGAVVASDSFGALSTAYGRTRDIVLGATLVTGDGRVLRLGGRVVKNVAGFDLLKLAVGSGGRLGLLTEVTVRLHPLPGRDETWVYLGPRDELVPLARAFATAPVVPTALDLRSATALPPGFVGSPTAWALVLRVGGTAAGAGAALDILAARALPRAPEYRLSGVDGERFHDASAAFPAAPALTLRATLPPARLAELVAESAAVAGRAGSGVRIRVLVTEGIAAVDLDAAAYQVIAATAPTLLATLRSRLTERGGSLTLTSAPADLLSQVPVHSADPARDALLERVIGTFDPGGVLRGAKGLQ